MSEHVRLESHESVGVITVNNAPVNALSYSVRKGLVDCVKAAEQDDNIKSIVIICEGRTFIAGADISEFGKTMQHPTLPEVLMELDKVNKPLVAALHGTALGGGLEVALTCHYRVALASAQIGLPEVQLGILPGAGGTQRLPRVAGVKASLDIITTGRKVKSAEALSIGAIDQVVEDDLLAATIEFAKGDLSVRRISELSIESTDAEVFEQYRAKVKKQQRGFNAPLACVDAVEAAATLPFEQGLEKERELFLSCLSSTQSASQRHIFFAQRQAAVIDDVPKDTPTRNIDSVAIIGAGTMGTGIALNFSNKGIPVKLLEVSQEGLDKGLKIVVDYYESRVTKGKMTAEQAAHCQSIVTGTLQYEDLSDVDLVIEAVFESMDIKKKVFTALDKHCKPGCILASNTSTLNIDEIAKSTSRPEDVIGLHFFSPAQVMKLLEVVRCEKTSKEVLKTSMNMGKTIGKIAVVSGVCDGFIGNRMLKGYGREAGALLLEGATPSQVDAAMYKFGMAMGPMTMGDLAGLDVGYRVRQERRERGEDVPVTDGIIADRLVEAGRMGQKSQKGYYRYEQGSRAPIPDDEVITIIEQASAELGIERRDISDEEIVKRLVYPLINEAALILEEGIAQRPSDVDVVYCFGYGFPIYRGGPMFYADTIGLKTLLDDMKSFQQTHGDQWAPAPLIERLVGEGKSFADL